MFEVRAVFGKTGLLTFKFTFTHLEDTLVKSSIQMRYPEGLDQVFSKDNMQDQVKEVHRNFKVSASEAKRLG